MKKTLLTSACLTCALLAMAQGGGGSTTTMGGTSSTGYSQSSGTNEVTSQTYTSTGSDENAVQVTGGTFTMNTCTVTKTGSDTQDEDGSSFYGINSAVYVGGSSAIVNMNGGTITTSTKGANGGFAYNGGTLNISDVTIRNTSNLSRGIHATGGGIINASNLDITTAGSNSSVVATDRGGGTVTVTGGSYVTTGTDCAVLYSTGTITATGITGSSSQGEIGVIEGDNSINIYDSEITSGASTRGLMILQSGSGDSEGYNGYITVDNSTLTLTDSDAPLCEVPTSMTGTLSLTDVTLTVPSGVLMYVDYNTRWSTYGGTGNLILDTDDEWTYTGDVKADQYGNITVTVNCGVTWNGAMDPDNTAASSAVTVSSCDGNEAVWSLTGDSYVDVLTNNGIIYTNGYNLTYGTLSGNGTISDSGVEEIATDGGNLPGNVYDLQGRELKTNTTNLDGLGNGIYILNGHKIKK